MSREELSFLDPDTAPDTLGQLIMDLGAQLHVERQARLALQAALIRKGVLTDGEIAGLADDPDFLAQARGGLEASISRLIRIMTEAGDRTGPLRAEAPEIES